MNRVYAWLFSEKSPRYFMLVTSVATFFASWWIADVAANKEVKAQIEIQKEQFKRSLIDDLRTTSRDFNVLAGAYVSSILDAGDVNDSRRQLMQSIQLQHSSVELSKIDFSPATRKKAELYQAKLVELSSIIQNVDEVLEMRPFWEKMSDVLVARDEFLISLAKNG